MEKKAGNWNIKRRSSIHIVGCYLVWMLSWAMYMIENEPENIKFASRVLIGVGGIYFIIVLGINCIAGRGGKKVFPSLKNGLYSYMNTWTFAVDLLQVLLPAAAFTGCFCRHLYLNYLRNADFEWLLYIIVMLSWGVIIWLVLAIFPYPYFKRIQKELINPQEASDIVWMSVSDTEHCISSFSLLPYIATVSTTQRDNSPVVVTEREIGIINKKYKCKLDYVNFDHYMIYLSGRKRNDQVVELVNRISKFPHAICLILAENEEVLNLYQKEIDKLRMSLKLRIIPVQKRIYDISVLEKYLADINSNFIVRNMNFDIEIMQNEYWIEKFTELNKGPQIITDMVIKIFHDLKPLAGLYAMFDLMDLMERLLLAFYAPTDKKWYSSEKHCRGIGNLLSMITMLEELTPTEEKENRPIFLGEELTGSQKRYCPYRGDRKVRLSDVLKEEEKDFISSYLPNYEFADSDANYGDIIFLCARLRDVIRGHGSVAPDRIFEAMLLIFKLVLLMYDILELDKMTFEYENADRRLTGKYGNKRKRFSYYQENESHDSDNMEFLFVCEKQMKFFNNYVKGVKGLKDEKKNKRQGYMEYIDFLSGKIMTPSYVRFEVL